jgi:hypothetical protein
MHDQFHRFPNRADPECRFCEDQGRLTLLQQVSSKDDGLVMDDATRRQVEFLVKKHYAVLGRLLDELECRIIQTNASDKEMALNATKDGLERIKEAKFDLGQGLPKPLIPRGV